MADITISLCVTVDIVDGILSCVCVCVCACVFVFKVDEL